MSSALGLDSFYDELDHQLACPKSLNRILPRKLPGITLVEVDRQD